MNFDENNSNNSQNNSEIKSENSDDTKGMNNPIFKIIGNPINGINEVIGSLELESISNIKNNGGIIINEVISMLFK